MSSQWVVAVRAAMPSPRPQAWQAVQQAVGLARSGGVEVILLADAARPEGGPDCVEAWLGHELPTTLRVVQPQRPLRPPSAGLVFRWRLGRLRSQTRTLLCRDPRVAAREGGRWGCVVMEWHIEPQSSLREHRRAVLRADLHVAVSPGLVQDLQAAGVPSDRIHLVPNACGLDRKRALVRAQLPRQVTGEGGFVLAMGLHRRAGLDQALSAWADDPALPDLVVAGRDQDGDQLNRWVARVARDEQLQGRVHFIGPVWGLDREDLLDRALAWLALYPRDKDSVNRLCPLQVADAAGAALPLVVSELPSIRALLGDVPANYVPVDDAAALRTAVQAAVEQDAEHRTRPSWQDRAEVLRHLAGGVSVGVAGHGAAPLGETG